MKKKLVFLGVAVSAIMVLGACASAPAATGDQPSMENKELPAAQGAPSSPLPRSALENEKQEPSFQNFTAQDIDGNSVDASLFSNADLTMINIWGTFCGPCLQEMPELGQIAQEYQDKSVQIVGIVMDVFHYDGTISNEQVNYAKEIVAETGANYRHLLPSDDLMEAKLKDVTGIPETIFVDKTGKVVGRSYMGARSKAEWTKVIDQMLEEVRK